MPRPSRKHDGFNSAADAFRDGVSRICRLYGQSPLLGHLFVELYLHEGALSLEELCVRVDAAKSTVSVAIRKLLSAHVVRRVQLRGDRRDLYEVVADPWVIFADWARYFLQPEMEMWRSTGSALQRALHAAPPEVNRLELGARIARMNEFADVVERVTEQLTRRRAAATATRAVPIRIDVEGEEP